MGSYVESMVLADDSGGFVDVGAGLTEGMLTWRRSGLLEVVRLLLTRESFRFLSLRKANKGDALKIFFVSVSVVSMLKLL